MSTRGGFQYGDLRGPDIERRLQFYMQVSAALIRRAGGTVTLMPAEFEEPCVGLQHRRAPDDSGIQVMVCETETPS